MSDFASSGINRGAGLNQKGGLENNENSLKITSTYNKEVKSSSKKTSESITYKTNVIKSITNVLKKLSSLEARIKSLGSNSDVSIPIDQENILNVSKSGNDVTGTGALGEEFLTIQAAITASSAGDTIFVYPGVYNENITLVQKNAVIGDFEVNNIVFNAGSSASTLNGNIVCDAITVAAGEINVNIKILNVQGVITLNGDYNNFEIGGMNIPAGSAITINGDYNNIEVKSIELSGIENGVDVFGNGCNVNVEYVKVVDGNAFRTSGTGSNVIKAGIIDVTGIGNGVELTGTGTLDIIIDTINLTGVGAFGISATNPAFDTPDANFNIGSIFLLANNTRGISLTSASEVIFTGNIGIIRSDGAVTGTRALSFETQAGNTITANFNISYLESVIAVYLNGGTDFNATISYMEGTTNTVVTNNASDTAYIFASDSVGAISEFAGSTIEITNPGSGGALTPSLWYYIDPTVSNSGNSGDATYVLAQIAALPLATRQNTMFYIQIANADTIDLDFVTAATGAISVYLKLEENVVIDNIYLDCDPTILSNSDNLIIIEGTQPSSMLGTNSTSINVIDSNWNNENAVPFISYCKIINTYVASITESNYLAGVSKLFSLKFKGTALSTCTLPYTGELGGYNAGYKFSGDDFLNCSIGAGDFQFYQVATTFRAIAFYNTQFDVLIDSGAGTPDAVKIEFTKDLGATDIPINLQLCDFVIWNVPASESTFPLEINSTASGAATVSIECDEPTIQGYKTRFDITSNVLAGGGSLTPTVSLYSTGANEVLIASAIDVTTVAPITDVTLINGGVADNPLVKYDAAGAIWKAYALASLGAAPPAHVGVNGEIYINTASVPPTQWINVNGVWTAIRRVVSEALAVPGTMTDINEGDVYIDTTTTPQTEWHYTGGAWVAVRRTLEEAAAAGGGLTFPNVGDIHIDSSGPLVITMYTTAGWEVIN